MLPAEVMKVMTCFFSIPDAQRSDLSFDRNKLEIIIIIIITISRMMRNKQ
jgi:hypothetical protein